MQQSRASAHHGAWSNKGHCLAWGFWPTHGLVQSSESPSWYFVQPGTSAHQGFIYWPLTNIVQPVISVQYGVLSNRWLLHVMWSAPPRDVCPIRFCAARGFCPTRDIYLICCYVQPGASAP